MSSVIDCQDSARLAEGVRFAAAAVRRGELVVLPTDTVYGVGADAFSAEAVRLLLEAKGRGREVPPPVLVPSRAPSTAWPIRCPPTLAASSSASGPVR